MATSMDDPTTMITIMTTRKRRPTVWRRGAAAIPALGMLLAGGCGGKASYYAPFGDVMDEELEAPHEDARRSYLDGPSPPAPLPEGEGGSAEPVFSPGATEEDYVRLALERNPGIRAARERVRRLSQRIPQVRSLDDPMVTVAPIGEMAQTAAGEVTVMTSLSQRLPFPGKLQTRGRIAAQGVAEAVQGFERVRLEVVADTRRAWWSFYYTTRAIEVTQRSRVLLAQIRDVAESKLKTGAATQQDVLRASVELSNLDSELVDLGQRQTTARAMLNRLINRTVTAPLPDPEPRRLDALTLELDTLLAEAQRVNPSIRMIQARIQGFRERLSLAKLDRWPDLTVSFSYNPVDSGGLSPVANGDDQWWVGFGVNLPIWAGRLDAAEAEAMRGIFEGIAALDDTQNRIAFRVQDALTKVESQQRQVILFRDVIIPQARQTVDASRSGYRAGTLDFLTLVDNWRQLLDFELMYHERLAQMEQSFAELQRAVGQDLTRLGRAEEGLQDADAEVEP